MSRSLLAALLLAVTPSVLPAQPADSLGEPIVVVNVASVDRVLEDVHWIFESIDRDDLLGNVDTVLNTVNNLKGIDRTKPLGVMGFAAAAGAGQPLVVGYVPVENLDTLMASITFATIRPERDPDVPGRWRIPRPGQAESPLYLEARDGYAWIVADEKLLDVKYPDPVETAKSLTERYDFSASFNIAAVPAGLRAIASFGIGQLSRQSSTRQPDETDEAYELRQLATRSATKFANQVIADGRDVVFGLEFSKPRREVRIEYALNAVPETDLAETLAGFRGAPSRFARAIDENDPMVFRSSWQLGDEVASLLASLAEQGRTRALAEADRNEDGPPRAALEAAFDVVHATAAKGRFDFAFRATGSPPGNMVLVGMLGVEKGEEIGRFYDAALEAAKEQEQGTITRNALEHDGVTLHRFTPNEVQDDQRRMFGAKPSILFGHDDRTLWFAMGGSRLEGTLKSAIDAATDESAQIRGAIPVPGDPPPPGTPKSGESGPPVVLFDAAAATMILLADERDEEFDAIAQKAFLPGGDRIRITLGPKPNGAAFGVTFGEGWVRLLGLGMAKGLDESR